MRSLVADLVLNDLGDLQMVEGIVETFYDLAVAGHALNDEPARHHLCQLFDLANSLMLVNELAFLSPLV